MHKRKICHRDIKTKNILIDLNDRTVLCDLGSARRMQTLDPPYTENMGTLWYRAP
jgi:serine/threonine protein kinase